MRNRFILTGLVILVAMVRPRIRVGGGAGSRLSADDHYRRDRDWEYDDDCKRSSGTLGPSWAASVAR